MMRRILLLMTLAAQLLYIVPLPVFAATAGGEEEMFFGDIPMVVTSTLREAKASTSPSTITVVTGEQIRKMGIRNLLDLVNRLIPGGAATEDNDDRVFSFRGVASDTSTKVLLLFNGHNYNMEHNIGPGGEGDLGLMEDIKSVEVITGPGSALYGEGATIGVINIIPYTGADERGQGATAMARYGGGYKRQLDYTTGAKKNDELNYFASFGGLRENGFNVHQKPGGYPIASGYPLNVDRIPLADRAYVNINYKELEVETRYTSSAKTFYNWPQRTGNPRALPWTNYDTFFVDAKQNIQASQNTKVVLNASVDSDQTSRHDYRLGTLIRSAGEDRYTAKATLFYSGFEKHDIIVGAMYRVDAFGGDWANNNFNFDTQITTNSVVTGQPVNPYLNRVVTPYTRSVEGVFAQDNMRLNEKLSLLLGLRYDYVKVPAGIKPDAFTPRAALVYTPDNRTVLKAMYSTGFRQGFAIFLDPDQFGNAATFTGSLKAPETMASYELTGTYQVSNPLRAGLNLFYNTFRNMHGISGFVLNSQAAIDYKGFESSLNMKMGDQVSGSVMHQHVQLGSKVYDPIQLYTSPNGKHIATFPEDVTKLQMEVRPMKKLSVNADANMVWKTYTLAKYFPAQNPVVDDRTTTSIGLYTAINANIVYTFGEHTDFTLSGYNLANYRGLVGTSYSGSSRVTAPASVEGTFRVKF